MRPSLSFIGAKPVATAVIALAMPAASLHAQFAPPAGYVGTPSPPVAGAVEPESPALAATTDFDRPGMISLMPGYPRKDAHVAVISAYTIAETKRARVTAAWSRGYLPVSLSFSDGRCFDFTADYNGPRLSNAQLTRIACGPPWKDGATPPPPPAGSALHLVGTGWGYAAWVNDKVGTSIITGPYAKTYQPYLAVRMPVIGIMAMNGVDYPGGNLTLVGRYRGRLSVVVLEVGY